MIFTFPSNSPVVFRLTFKVTTFSSCLATEISWGVLSPLAGHKVMCWPCCVESGTIPPLCSLCNLNPLVKFHNSHWLYLKRVRSPIFFSVKNHDCNRIIITAVMVTVNTPGRLLRVMQYAVYFTGGLYHSSHWPCKIPFLAWFCMYACSGVHSCLTLCDPMDSTYPGSSVHGIFQAKILGWVAISSSRGSSWPKDWTHILYVSCIGRWVLYHWVTWEAQEK